MITRAFSPASRSRVRCPCVSPVSASASSPHTRSAMLVSSRNRRTSGGWPASTSRARYSATVRSVPANSSSPAFGVALAQEHRGEPQAGGPALGPIEQDLDLGGGELHVVAGQQLGGLVEGEAQLRGADLGQSLPDPRPVQRQRAVLAGGDHQPQLRHGMAQQERQRPEHLRIVDLVQVFQHEHHRAGKSGDPAGDPAHEGLVDAGSGKDRRERIVVGDGAGAAKCADQVRPERGRTVVVAVQREPRDRSGRPAGLGPGRDEQGLARARPRDEQRDLAPGTLVQPVHQASADDEGRRKLRPGELGRQQAAGAARWRGCPYMWNMPPPIRHR